MHSPQDIGSVDCEDITFADEDPRFGLIVLSEIAIRAWSPAMNDPGTAIDIIGRFVRLLLVNRLRLIARKPAMNEQQAFGIVAMFYAAVKPTIESKQAAHR